MAYIEYSRDNFRESNQEKKLRTVTINEAEKLQSNNFTRCNREKSNIAILEKCMIRFVLSDILNKLKSKMDV